MSTSATPQIYTLSLHDALPIYPEVVAGMLNASRHASTLAALTARERDVLALMAEGRSEEHTSELQSHVNLVCRLLLEKKKTHTRNELQNRVCLGFQHAFHEQLA